MTKKLIYFFLFLSCFSFTSKGQRKIDSLLTLLKSDKEDTNKANDLIRLAFQYDLESRVRTAITYEDSAIAISKRLNFPVGYAAACSDMGSFYSDLEEYAPAMNFFTLAIKAYEKVNDKHGLASLKNNLGEFYDVQGNYPKALEYYFEALTIEKELGRQKGSASILANIGVIYWKQGEYNKALDYDSNALIIYRSDPDKHHLASVLGNMGVVYYSKKEYDKALEYYKQAISIQEKLNYKKGIAINTADIGMVYFDQADYAKALDYNEEALKLYKELEDKEGVEITMDDIGSIYFKEKKYKEAESYLLQAYTSAQNIKAMEGIRDVSKNLSDLYTETGQMQKALESYKRYVLAKDSLVNETKSKEIGRIEAKAEYEKQLAIQQAKEDAKIALNQAESKRQRLLNYLIAAIALIAVLIAFNIFRLLKTTRKQKLIAEKQKVLQELKTLRVQMNPHFIFNAINSIKNVVLENDSAAASKHLSTFSKLMREVLENSKHESIPLAKELQMLTLYIDLELLRFSSKFTYSISVDSAINVENVLISPLIIQPYVENAIWHGLMHLQERKGELTIRIENMNNGMMKCTIDDNGIGREKSAEAKKGKIYQSLGLSITQERLEIINSLYKSNISMQIIDKKNSDGSSAGTCVELILPLMTNR